MAYTPINWQTGDTITAEKMNKMDNGWSASSTQLFSETVTTAESSGMITATLAYTGTINYDSITVTFDGSDYNCDVTDMGGAHFYGGIGQHGPDFSEYPFAIQSVGGANEVFTETAGSHTISVSVVGIEYSSNFSEAVNACVIPQMVVAKPNVTTWQAIYDAVSAGKIVCIFATESGGLYARYVIGVESKGYNVETVGVYYNELSLLYYKADSANSPIYPN